MRRQRYKGKFFKSADNLHEQDFQFWCSTDLRKKKINISKMNDEFVGLNTTAPENPN